MKAREFIELISYKSMEALQADTSPKGFYHGEILEEVCH